MVASIVVGRVPTRAGRPRWSRPRRRPPYRVASPYLAFALLTAAVLVVPLAYYLLARNTNTPLTVTRQLESELDRT